MTRCQQDQPARQEDQVEHRNERQPSQRSANTLRQPTPEPLPTRENPRKEKSADENNYSHCAEQPSSHRFALVEEEGSHSSGNRRLPKNPAEVFAATVWIVLNHD